MLTRCWQTHHRSTLIELSRAPKCNRKCWGRKTHWSWNIDGEPQDSLIFFFFSREADERNPPCNERLHSVAGAGGTAASSVVRKLAVSTRCFWYPPRLPNCVENCTVIRQKVNIVCFLVFFPTAGAGLFFFFGHRSGASFLLCAYVSSPPPTLLPHVGD